MNDEAHIRDADAAVTKIDLARRHARQAARLGLLAPGVGQPQRQAGRAVRRPFRALRDVDESPSRSGSDARAGLWESHASG